MDLKKLKDRINSNLSQMETEQSSWRSHWEEIGEQCYPRAGRFSDGSDTVNKGEKVNQKIVNGAPIRALRVFGAGYQGGMTNPARPWFKLGLSDKDLMEYGPVRQWLYQVERLLYEIFARSNTYNTFHNAYLELGAFGTSAFMVTEDYDSVIRCHPFTVGEYYLAMGSDLRVDTCYRKMFMTVRQVVERFGADNCSGTVRAMYDKGNYNQWVPVVHAVEPNTEQDLGRQDWAGKPFRSTYFEEGSSDKFLRLAGFEENPIISPRFTVIGSNIYGYSPMMDALGDCKRLQKTETKSLVALDKMVDPPLVGPSALKMAAVNTMPRGITYLDEDNGHGLRSLYDVRFDIGAAEQKIQQIKQDIGEMLYNDLFMMLIQSDRRQITATEVAEKHDEKLSQLGPALTRLQEELLDKMIDRAFAVASRAGLIPPAPEEIQGMPLRIEYVSVLAQAQKMSGITAIEQLSGFVGNMAGVNPQILDKFDMDEAVDQYAEMIGVPPNLVVPDEAVAQIRQRRAQAQAAQEQQAQMQGMAQGAKTLSETDVSGENNALSMLLGGMQ